MSFVNTGDTSTSIDYVLLNLVPYNDLGWTGSSIPAVSGDLTPQTVIETGTAYSGTITFSDDCKDPSGNKLTAGTVQITIHTTGGKDYGTSIMLPESMSTSSQEVNQLGTTLTLSSPSNVIQFMPVTLKATLKDERGKPVRGVMIHFRPLQGDGIVVDHAILTDSDGIASFADGFLIDTIQIQAIFYGTRDYAGSTAMITLTVQPIAPYILVVVIAVATFGLLVKKRKNRPSPPL